VSRVTALALALMLLASGAAAEEPMRLADLGLKGQAVFKSFSHFSATPNDDQTFVDLALLQLEWSRRFQGWGVAKAVVEARDDDFGYTRGLHFQIPETYPRRSYLSVKEATLAAQRGPLEVTVGKQIFAWGTADAYNPTDRLNPYDYLDPLDNEKLGVWSAAARLGAPRINLLVVAVPFFTPSRLPLAHSRWTPTVPPAFVAVVDHPELPEQDASATQYAARLKGTLAGWDLSISYYDGFEHTPVFRGSTIAIAPGVTLPRLTPVFTRERVPGADFSTTFGRFEVHAEAVARLVDENGRNDRFQAIAGLNYTLDVGHRRLDQILFVVEYARETVLRHHRHSDIVDSNRVPLVGARLANNAFRDAVVGRVQAKLSEDTVLKLSGIADLSGPPSHYIQFKGSHRITDALHVEAGLDFLTGKPDTFWGRWGDNDRFFAVLRYLF
jgi:hypothetical protein